MIAARAKWSTYIDQQHRKPDGYIGRLIGDRMLRQHTPETTWSIELLQLQPADRVLEIGFGAGRGLKLALAGSPLGHVTGIDLSATMIDVVARRYRTARTHHQLSLLRGDIAALPFQDQRFDKIVSVHTFYFWPDQQANLRQITSLLAPGGRCVTTFATARTESTGERVYWPLHDQAKAIVKTLQHDSGMHVSLQSGPDSRQFNNIAIVIENRKEQL